MEDIVKTLHDRNTYKGEAIHLCPRHSSTSRDNWRIYLHNDTIDDWQRLYITTFVDKYKTSGRTGLFEVVPDRWWESCMSCTRATCGRGKPSPHPPDLAAAHSWTHVTSPCNKPTASWFRRRHGIWRVRTESAFPGTQHRVGMLLCLGRWQETQQTPTATVETMHTIIGDGLC